VAAFIGVVVLSALLLGVAAWVRMPLGGGMLLPTGILCLMGVVGSSSGRNAVGDKIGLNFASIIELAAVAIIGPFGAWAVGACTYLFQMQARKRRVRVFNAAMDASTSTMAGFAYIAAGGALPVSGNRGVGYLLVSVGLPLMLADVVLCLANAMILSGIVRLSQGVPMRRFVARMLGTSGPAYLGYGIIGFLFVVLWVPAGVGIFSTLLILAPLFVARWAFVQYGDELSAHQRTLSALVTAVEIKDPHTRGHSERVAQLCTVIAGTLSLSHQDTEALHYAGMLHDIGKLGIPAGILRTTETPSDANLAAITMHPARGVEIVREIDFLRASFEGILHHHERYDGRGYPVGLAGEDIPLFARIIAVADAFDSLTTSRPHREAHSVAAALTELHARAGSQLDPAMVSALDRGLARHLWEPPRLEPALLAATGRAFDHDDPASSDLMADRASSVHGPVGLRPETTP